MMQQIKTGGFADQYRPNRKANSPKLKSDTA